MHRRLQSAVGAFIGLAIFVAAVSVLRRELHAITWDALTVDVLTTPLSRLIPAVLLTSISYLVLTCHDFIGFAYIGKHLPRSRIAGTSLVACAISHSVGVAMLSSVSIRYRFYTRWGVTTEELSRIVFLNAITFWLGLIVLGGVSLALSLPPRVPHVPPWFSSGFGWTLVAASVAYIMATILYKQPLRVGRLTLRLPSPRLAMLQLAVSAIDWALAGAVLYVLLPPSDASFLTFIGLFLVAQLIGLLSLVPGSVGVFEGLMLLMLKPYLPSAVLLPSLIVYRAVYYLLPLSVGIAALVADEVRLRRAYAARVTRGAGRLVEQLTPQVFAILTFLAGAILLFSGATPAAAGRLQQLNRVVPLGIVETSHVIGSVIGVVLLLLSQGLSRRLDAAYYLTIVGLAGGTVASLLKGIDYEEALVLFALLLTLARARRMFTRKAALFATRFSMPWVASVTVALAASVWLGLFAFRHVEYSDDLWWQFELDAQASRFLRGSVGAASILLVLATARLIGHAPPEADAPSDRDLRDASAVIAVQRSTVPYLVYLRDKALLFDEHRQGFVMYGVQGRTWVALGDPVGPPACVPELIRLFLEKSHDFGGTPVFYEIAPDHLHHYADFGLTFIKLGEAANVDLTKFTFDGKQGAKFRQAVRRLENESGSFRLLPATDVPSVREELESVSNDWLTKRAGGEKGFSVGFFDPEYIVQFPVAVIERVGRIQAFATVLPGPHQEELSVDLMRYRHDAPHGVMEALFVHLMAWGKEEGYQRFALGMAPLSGFEPSPIAPLWTRAGGFLYEHGESLYKFQGLRAFKEKFHPAWESHYLAYPGGLTLPRILADVSVLIAGGYRRILMTSA